MSRFATYTIEWFLPKRYATNSAYTHPSSPLLPSILSPPTWSSLYFWGSKRDHFNRYRYFYHYNLYLNILACLLTFALTRDPSHPPHYGTRPIQCKYSYLPSPPFPIFQSPFIHSCTAHVPKFIHVSLSQIHNKTVPTLYFIMSLFSSTSK